jgi:restriction system protein
MKSYYRLMLGQRSKYANDCFNGAFVGTDFNLHVDLNGRLPPEWRAFNKQFIPIYLESHPGKSKISAGLACGAIWTVSKGMQKGDILLSPDGAGNYRVGEIAGEYYYAEGQILPHRRPVQWRNTYVSRDSMSEGLQNSTGAIGTVSNVTKHAIELENLICGNELAKVITTDETVEDPAAFAMEKHLEDFLVQNWAHTELGTQYDIFHEEDESVGQQYPTDTGPIDIFAISKDRKTLLVVELKKGRASDVVVGQILRYMGYVAEELAEPGQTVKGIVIALDDDQRLRRALAIVPSIDFYKYAINFRLVKS